MNGNDTNADESFKRIVSGTIVLYLIAKVEAREFTINRAVLALLDSGEIVEVELENVVGLKKNEPQNNQH